MEQPYVFGTIVTPDQAWLARALPEPVIEPDLPIVDTHVDFWHLRDGFRYFVEEYAADVVSSGHNVTATVFVECRAMYRDDGPEHLRCIGETEFAVGMAAIGASGRYCRTQVAAAIVGFADLRLGERTRETLEAHVEAGNGRFRGVRQRGKWDADPLVCGAEPGDSEGVYLQADFGDGIDALTSMGLSFDASVYHPQIPDVTTLARRHPSASIILNHCGSPVGHGSYAGKEMETRANWLASMKELAKCENVTVKLGGMLMHLATFDFTREARPPTSRQLADLWRPYIEPCIELFGAERCMVDSHYPVDKAGVPYGTIWNMLKSIASPCSNDEKRLIFSDTAKRVYRIDL